MKKILFVANIHKHFLAFHIPYIKWLKDEGYEVHVAAGGDPNVHVPIADKQFNIHIERNPFRFSNIKACRELRTIIEKERYCLVHCHTAMGSVVARLAARKARANGTLKIIYTAHGFHFFKGSPIYYWLMYYPMEKYLSRYTDALITINHEDYNMVKTHGFRNLHTYIIPGIGINTERLIITSPEIRHQLRGEYGYGLNKIILIYIAEYIPRKNHKFIIDAMPDLIKTIPNIQVLFAGRGKLMGKMQAYAKRLNVIDYIDFLGFRKDIGQLIALSDIGISSSRQEGLGMNIAEEMYSGIPVVASEDRGHKDLIIQDINGIIYPQMDKNSFVQAISMLAQNQSVRIRMGARARDSVQKFLLENTLQEMIKIYKIYL